ncbi:MAG TPA: GYD domain-containing protein [Xanthobacteraceae bacterium]|nr:GYD domain-containing protein [Xanthobacteraceae bacterium]
MPIYISRGRFTADAVKGMLAKPENREEAVAKLFESVGGRLIGWYLTFGRHDWMVIGEFPNEKAAASAVLAAAAGGSLSDIETTVAMTAKEAQATFEAAGKAAKNFRSAGRR